MSQAGSAREHESLVVASFGWLDPTFVDGIGPPLEQIEEDCRDAIDLPGTEPRQHLDVLALIAEVKSLRGQLVGIPGSTETVARGDSVTTETCTDSAQNLAEWVEATIDYLVLDEPRPATLDEYVSKPTLARKAKDKVALLARRGDALEELVAALETNSESGAPDWAWNALRGLPDGRQVKG